MALPIGAQVVEARGVERTAPESQVDPRKMEKFEERCFFRPNIPPGGHFRVNTMVHYANASDTELLSAWADRQDEVAFEQLVERYQSLVFQAGRSVCNNDEFLADDVSQATFVTLARKASSLSGRNSLGGWLHATAYLQARNIMRHRSRESLKHDRLRLQSPEGGHQQEPSELEPYLGTALTMLSEKDREAILLRFYRSLSVKEMAGVLNIAATAAQKRIDRALERLRCRLQKMGYSTQANFNAALVVSLAPKKLPVVAASSVLTKKAIAAASVGSTSTYLGATALAIMTTKTAIISTASVVLLGAGAYLLLSGNEDDQVVQNIEELATKRVTRQRSEMRPDPSQYRQTINPPARPREDRGTTAYPTLAAKYGEARTNLAKKVYTNTVDLFQVITDMGDLVTSGEHPDAFGGPEGRVRGGMGATYDALNLSQEQKDKVNASFFEFQKRQNAKGKQAIASFNQKSEAVMEIVLAGDAFKRNAMSEEDYNDILNVRKAEVENLMNPLNEKDMKGRPLRDPQFNAELLRILSQEQAELFNEAVAEAGKDDKNTSDGLPPMELEKLDSTVEGILKIVTGIRNLAEAGK